MNVWLWDAPGHLRSSCGVTSDRAAAQRAARACLASGEAIVALIQEADLVLGSSALTVGHRPIGACWQASRTANGTIRWHPVTALAAS